jgi:hypothetical protein
MTTVALFGAGGNMGIRLTGTLGKDPNYRLLYVEPGEAGQARLRERGLTITSRDAAVKEADAVILAVPDKLVKAVAHDVVPDLKPGAIVLCLDPAAPFAKHLPERPDVSYFITHPAHPPVFNVEETMEARRDFFGSGKAKQAIVSALMQGPEEDYARGEAIAGRHVRAGPALAPRHGRADGHFGTRIERNRGSHLRGRDARGNGRRPSSAACPAKPPATFCSATSTSRSPSCSTR